MLRTRAESTAGLAGALYLIQKARCRFGHIYPVFAFEQVHQLVCGRMVELTVNLGGLRPSEKESTLGSD
jgi:hypothetical protein